ncbi:MAG TPA: aromatic ring-hydroxylating dioxygenase subunit alpha [Opitutaceae bacterium]|jgi:vanillate O-demethylase monooxygenase subunit
MTGPSIAFLVRPDEGTFSEKARDILASFWHPVAYESELGPKPVGRRLLDVRLVVFRGEGGVAVARDLCAHRGASLSKGWMEGSSLVCAYHGFTYGGDGRCIRIPAQDPSIPISERLRLQTFPAEVRHGIVWTCLRPPATAPIPDWPDLSGPGRQTMEIPASVWKAAAARQVENFNDVAHLSWVHAGTFGNRNEPRIDDYVVREEKSLLEFSLTYPQVDRDTFEKREPTIAQMRYVYTLNLPFATRLGIHSPDGRVLDIYDIATPETARRSRIHMVLSRNYDQSDAPGLAIDYQTHVNQEDIPVVEDQYPEDLPLDLRQEVHIAADRMSIAYRKRLRLLGLSGDWIA